MEEVTHLGGGGCPAYDVLVPDLPFDFLQPVMTRQVTQAGYGGPFVIRSNPIGAIFDAIRGFCFPVAMQASSDGSQYDATSGLDTYGGNTSTDLGALGYGGGSYGNQMTTPVVPPPAPSTTPAVSPGGNAGANTPVYQCDDPNFLMMVAQQEGMFFAMKDVYSLCTISQPTINSCVSASAVPAIKAQWVALSARTVAHLQALGCSSCATCKQNKPAGMMMPPPPPPTPGAGTGMGMGNPMDGNTGRKGGGPLDYINQSKTGQGTTVKPGPGSGTVTNPPSMMPPNIAAEPIPFLPNPTSLTEGNVYMTPSANPMGGSFDPSANIQRARVIRTSFASRMFRRGM